MGKKALHRQINVPVPKLICVILVISFMAVVGEKNHFGEKRWKCTHMLCVCTVRLHKIYWKNQGL